MRQTKESNKRAPGRVVIHISVHLVLIYTLTSSNVLLVLALNLIVHKPSYCKCSLAWCQVRTFLLFTIWTHPLQMREYPLKYASTDKNKKSHYNIYTIMTMQEWWSTRAKCVGSNINNQQLKAFLVRTYRARGQKKPKKNQKKKNSNKQKTKTIT